ncbi:2Fe-2S iron-sulfur cluster binding domain-containing protein [Mangrovitalea sediminis]|uniref:2Fe-2S iron-sulfur cluster binding domain-containing protein n=1 Tax=Mangrovitalea sediminis TaxID=1982043 RepID=UPI000BE61180|nr:2Fe-2S iron-sulfur cluster binding domain-containing protein [Mangrovitalea sediminis]
MSECIYTVSLSDTGESYPCSDEQNLLRAMEALGRKGIPVGCRGGGCGVCKIRVGEGRIRALKMSRAHVTAEEEAEGVVLACRAFPLSDLRLAVIGKMRKNLCRIQSAPGAGHKQT